MPSRRQPPPLFACLRWLVAASLPLAIASPLGLAGQSTVEAELPHEADAEPQYAADAGLQDEIQPLEITVSVTASRQESKVFEEAATVEVVGHTDLVERKKVANMADAFQELPAVSVQKTAQGQGSPFIRGVTGFLNLMLIDGIRFNNSVFRSGPNQYWATIDPLAATRVELVKGPGSMLYGSDAVGGTANVITRNPTISDGGTHGDVTYRWSDAARQNIARLEVQGSHEDKLGFIIGGTYGDYGDFEAGSETGTVDNSAYDEWGFDGKLMVFPATGHLLTFVAQAFRQDAVPRTETTIFSKPWEGTKAGSELQRDHDQRRWLSYLRYNLSRPDGPVEETELTFSYQRTREDRTRIRSRNRPDEQGFGVDTFGAQAQLASSTSFGRLTYGAEFYHDRVDSYRIDYNSDGSVKQVRIQGAVADDASYDVLGLYLQDRVSFSDELLTLTAGGRFTWVDLDARRVADPVTGDAISITDDYSSLIGSVRFLLRPEVRGADRWRLFASVAQSFRAPNLSDVTSFDATSAIETPTTGLEPEQYVTLEVGARARSDRLSLSGAYFHTFINDQIVQSPTGRSVDGIPEVQKSNVGDGSIKGFEMAASFDVLPALRLWGNLSYIEGEVDQFLFAEDGSPTRVRAPASRIIPWMSNWGVRYDPEDRGWWLELHGTAYSDADKLALRDITDTRRIPPGGTPGFTVVGFRGAARLFDERLTLAGGVENLTNRDYRIHGSGQNMPGRNLTLLATLRW